MQRLQILINLADRCVQVGMERILEQISGEEFGMPGYTKFLSYFLFSNYQELFLQEEKLDHIGDNILIIVSHNGAVIGPIRITGLHRVKTLHFHCQQ